MEEEYNRLEEKIDHNKDLLIDIKEELVKEISLLKMAHQKLKYTMIIMSIIYVVALGRPELVKAFTLFQ